MQRNHNPRNEEIFKIHHEFIEGCEYGTGLMRSSHNQKEQWDYMGNVDFLTTLAYLVYIFGLLKVLNLALQGRNINISDMNENWGIHEEALSLERSH